MDHQKLASLAWLGLTPDEISEIDKGPLHQGLFFREENFPARLTKVMSHPDYFPFLCKHILNVEILPLQHTILKEMWNHPFPMLIGSRGLSKTFMLALYSILRALLLHPRKIVVAGGGFRQSKFVAEYVRTIWENAPILRDICKSRNSDSQGIKQGADMWSINIGKSTIHFIPIGDGTKVRGLRGHDVIVDEFSAVNEEVFEVVLVAFGAVASNPIESVKLAARIKYLKEHGLWEDIKEAKESSSIVPNQVVISGTAYYRFNHFYRHFKRYHDIISSGGDPKKLEEILGEPPRKEFKHDDFTIIRFPYELIPEGFMDARLVARSKATSHVSNYFMEYGAVFPEDSNGFFSRKLIESCVGSDDNDIRFPSGDAIFTAELEGAKGRKYIYGIDPASEKDNFSIVILEVWPEHQRVVYCWTTTRQRHKERVKEGATRERDFYSYCCRKIRDLMKVFPTDHIAIDSQGGGRAIEEGLHDDDKIQQGELPIWPVIDRDKPQPTDNEPGLHVLHMINFASADWTSDANHGMRKDLEDKVLLFPFFSSAKLGVAMEIDQELGRTSDSLEDCVFDIEELKDELASIQHSQTGVSMRDRWDTPEIKLPGTNKKGRQRKDRYSALLMANMITRSLRRRPTKMKGSEFGGFANQQTSSKADKMYASGPDWFTKWAEEAYK